MLDECILSVLRGCQCRLVYFSWVWEYEGFDRCGERWFYMVCVGKRVAALQSQLFVESWPRVSGERGKSGGWLAFYVVLAQGVSHVACLLACSLPSWGLAGLVDMR